MSLRRCTVVMAAMAAMIVPAACGGDESGSEGQPADEGGTLTFANWQWQEPGRGEAIFKAVAAYNEENPQARIEKVEITRADYEKTISTQIGSGGGPDILISPAAFFFTMADSEVLEPLDGVLSRQQVASLRPNNKEFRVGGEQLAYIWGMAPYALFWNKQVLDEAGVKPPKTFQELIAAAEQVNERTGKIGFVTRHQLNEEASWWEDFSSWPYGFGGGWSTGGDLTINSPENVAALTAFEKIYDSGAFGVGDDASTFRSKFAAGDVGFVLDNASVVSTAIADSDSVTAADIGSSALPFPGSSSAAQMNVIGINANSTNKRLAKDFVRWLFERQTQIDMADAQFPASAGTNVSPPRDKLEANPWVGAFLDQLEEAQPTVVPGFEIETPALRNIILTRIQEVLTSETTPQEALDSAQEDASGLR